MENYKRDFTSDKDELKQLTFSICSDTPYTRYSEKNGEYDEVLVISEDSVDFSRLGSGHCSFLKDHDQSFVLGVITKSWIEGNKVKCTVKFSERADRYVKDIEDGILTNTSIGYNIEDYYWENVNGRKTMYVTRFLIYEASLVGVPADNSVGYQRSLETKMEEDKKNCEETEEQKAAREAAEKEAQEKAEKEAKEAKEAEERAKAEEEKRQAEEAAKREAEAKAQREAEIAEIRSLAELTETSELAEKYINENKSYSEFKDAVKEFKNTEQRKLNVKENNMDNEKKNFSLTKALNMFTKNFKGNIEDTDEYKVIEENKRNLGINDADIVVTRDNLRAFPNGTESLNQPIYRPDMYTENLRPQNVIAKTGCRVVDVDGPSINFSVATSGVNAGFVDINGEIPSADMAWSLKTLQPKKLGAYVEIDYKALLQDRPSIEAIITDDIVRGLDQAKDEAILVGDGNNNKPVGIVGTSGINEVPISSAFTLSGVYGFEKEIRDSNDYAEDLTWVMNSKNYYKYATTPYSATEQNRMLLEDGKIINHPVVISNALDDNTIILGNFNELLVANFDGIRLKVVEDAALSRKQAVEVQAFEAMDCLVRRPKSFTISKGE